MKTIITICLALLTNVAVAQSSGTEFQVGASLHSIDRTFEPGTVVRWFIPRDYKGNIALSFEGNASYPIIGFEIEFVLPAGFTLIAGPLLNVKDFDPHHPGGQALLTRRLFRSYGTDFVLAAGARKHPGDNPDFGFLSQVLFRFDISGK